MRFIFLVYPIAKSIIYLQKNNQEMNYQELKNKFGYRDRHHNIGFIKFSKTRMLDFATIIVDCLNELHNLGDDLTDKDYPKVKELLDKLEFNACCYRSMSYRDPDNRSISPQQMIQESQMNETDNLH